MEAWGASGARALAGRADPYSLVDPQILGILGAPPALAGREGPCGLAGSRVPGPGLCAPAAGEESGAGCCPDCSFSLVVKGLAFECPQCARVFVDEADRAAELHRTAAKTPGEASMRGRLRVVGPEASWFQPDMDRSNPVEGREIQKRAVYTELQRLNRDFEGRGGKPFPLDVLQAVARHYNVVQARCVKRSQQKRKILSALLYHLCIKNGFHRSEKDAADFAQLSTKGIAGGDDFLREAGFAGQDLDLDKNPTHPLIRTAMSLLDLYVDDHPAVAAATAAIVGVAEEQMLSSDTVKQSKVNAALYEVLRRSGVTVRLAEFAEKCETRSATLKKFLNVLADYHSFFEKLYEKHGLDGAPPPLAEDVKKSKKKGRRAAGPTSRRSGSGGRSPP
jgi:transcription initiation factor TFIIIB Brf1 subunit/transcription initiation factor TFIIB